MRILDVAEQPHVFISMPVAALAEADIRPDDVFEIYVKGNKIIMQKADPENFLCDGDCANCPFGEVECAEDDK